MSQAHAAAPSLTPTAIALRYVGGPVGLGLGYWIKYILDRRFVFQNGRT